MKLRKRYPTNYYESQEPSFDDYVYCDHCADFVFEYCSIHGGLLVIPDEKVPAKTNYPSFVPRAALTIPKVFLHLAPSIMPGAGLGVFSTLTLPRGVRFGPYRGRSTTDIESTYCWQLHERDRRKNGVVDASDPNTSNWMRYVNCARHWCEQNLVAYQYQGQIYYRTIKIIPRFTELLVFYGGEFAHLLDINLKKYDDHKYYSTIQGYSLKGEARNVTDTVSSEYGRIRLEPTYSLDTVSDTLRATPLTKTSIGAPIQRQQTEVLLIEDIAEIPKYEDYVTDKTKSNNQKAISDKNLDIEAATIEDFVIIDEEHLFNEEMSENDFNNDFTPRVEYVEENNNFLINFNSTEDNNDITKENSHKYTCNFCNKNFINAYILKNHINSEHVTRICHLCNFSSVSRYNILRHIREVHGKMHPYTNCDICDLHIKVRCLGRHLKRVHSLPCIVCSNCCFRTYSNVSMQNHMLSHSQEKGETYHKCDKCSYENRYKRNLNSHKRRVHKKKE